MKNMKLILEGWRDFLKDSEENKIPKLSPPDSLPPAIDGYPDMVGRKASDQHFDPSRRGKPKTLKIDWDPANPAIAIKNLEANLDRMLKDDSDWNNTAGEGPWTLRPAGQMDLFSSDLDTMLDTMSGLDPATRERLDAKLQLVRKEILGRADTLDQK